MLNKGTPPCSVRIILSLFRQKDKVRTFIGGHDIAIGFHLSDTVRRFQALTTTGLSGRLEGVEEMPGVQGFES